MFKNPTKLRSRALQLLFPFCGHNYQLMGESGLKTQDSRSIFTNMYSKVDKNRSTLIDTTAIAMHTVFKFKNI